MLAIVWRAAKPITRPSTALDARIPVASRWILAKLLSASAAPISRIATKTRRRIRRNRVCAARETLTSVTRPATWPARAITSRSTMKAVTIATAIVIRAEIRSPCCCQKLWSTR